MLLFVAALKLIATAIMWCFSEVRLQVEKWAALSIGNSSVEIWETGAVHPVYVMMMDGTGRVETAMRLQEVEPDQAVVVTTLVNLTSIPMLKRDEKWSLQEDEEIWTVSEDTDSTNVVELVSFVTVSASSESVASLVQDVDHLGISGDTAEETAGKAAEEDDGALGERGRELETDEVKAGTPAVQSQPTTWTISVTSPHLEDRVVLVSWVSLFYFLARWVLAVAIPTGMIATIIIICATWLKHHRQDEVLKQYASESAPLLGVAPSDYTTENCAAVNDSAGPADVSLIASTTDSREQVEPEDIHSGCKQEAQAALVRASILESQLNLIHREAEARFEDKLAEAQNRYHVEIEAKLSSVLAEAQAKLALAAEHYDALREEILELEDDYEEDAREDGINIENYSKTITRLNSALDHSTRAFDIQKAHNARLSVLLQAKSQQGVDQLAALSQSAAVELENLRIRLDGERRQAELTAEKSRAAEREAADQTRRDQSKENRSLIAQLKAAKVQAAEQSSLKNNLTRVREELTSANSEIYKLQKSSEDSERTINLLKSQNLRAEEDTRNVRQLLEVSRKAVETRQLAIKNRETAVNRLERKLLEKEGHLERARVERGQAEAQLAHRASINKAPFVETLGLAKNGFAQQKEPVETERPGAADDETNAPSEPTSVANSDLLPLPLNSTIVATDNSTAPAAKSSNRPSPNQSAEGSSDSMPSPHLASYASSFSSSPYRSVRFNTVELGPTKGVSPSRPRSAFLPGKFNPREQEGRSPTSDLDTAGIRSAEASEFLSRLLAIDGTPEQRKKAADQAWGSIDDKVRELQLSRAQNQSQGVSLPSSPSFVEQILTEETDENEFQQTEPDGTRLVTKTPSIVSEDKDWSEDEAVFRKDVIANTVSALPSAPAARRKNAVGSSASMWAGSPFSSNPTAASLPKQIRDMDVGPGRHAARKIVQTDPKPSKELVRFDKVDEKDFWVGSKQEPACGNTSGKDIWETIPEDIRSSGSSSGYRDSLHWPESCGESGYILTSTSPAAQKRAAQRGHAQRSHLGAEAASPTPASGKPPRSRPAIGGLSMHDPAFKKHGERNVLAQSTGYGRNPSVEGTSGQEIRNSTNGKGRAW